LNAEDDLYDELYDVRNEAEQTGNFVDVDPYPLMNAAREQAPVHRGFLREVLGLPKFHRHKLMTEGRQAYSVFSYACAEQAFRDNVRFSSRVYSMSETGEKTMGILEMDNPEHQAHRRAAQLLFIKPRAVSWWRERWINSIVEALVQNLHGQDRAELNMQVCARLPVHTITLAVGLRGDDALLFRQALLKSMGGRFGPAARQEGYAIVHRMLMEQIEKRRVARDEDIISWLLDAEIDLPPEGKRPLTDLEIVTFAKLLLVAGGGTTWRQFGIVLLALMTHLDQFEAVRADRGLVETAIEESVRWNPTNPLFSRLVVQETELGGVTVPEGVVLDICLGAGNRDPSRWDNPDAYDLHRPFKQHLGFGAGSHMCLGRNVAVSEMYAGLNALMDHFPNIRLDPDQPSPFITGGLEQRGVSALPVLLT
jgi:cytochrome P450